MPNITLIAPLGTGGIITTSKTQTKYQIGLDGTVSVDTRDVGDLLDAGFTIANFGNLIGRVLGANMNVATDQPFVMLGGALFRPFRVTKVTAKGASISLTTAAGGIYTGAAKAGTALVAAAQAYSGLTASTLANDLTIVAGAVANTVWAAAQGFNLSLTTPQGAPATADFFMYGDVYF